MPIAPARRRRHSFTHLKHSPRASLLHFAHRNLPWWPFCNNCGHHRRHNERERERAHTEPRTRHSTAAGKREADEGAHVVDRRNVHLVYAETAPNLSGNKNDPTKRSRLAMTATAAAVAAFTFRNPTRRTNTHTACHHTIKRAARYSTWIVCV